jgi:hypothetical protein
LWLHAILDAASIFAQFGGLEQIDEKRRGPCRPAMP